MTEPVFSLDIGTRKVAAFVGRPGDERIDIIAGRILEHKSRAVRAGQIHDIDKVAAVVRELKDALQQEAGIELRKVATAVAGRNLKCYRATGEYTFATPQEITADDMRQAELAGIHSVMAQVGREIDDFHFVGHTVVRWDIDGDEISHPRGHYARSLKCELVTTFLPRPVLESLFAVARRADLEISYLTLEPIAAVEAVFPPGTRHIPLVLVDIGAGTSDIAVITGGSIQAFGMIPLAGDYISEFICSEFLVDFNEAERMKRLLGDALRAEPAADSLFKDGNDLATIAYTDIFGRKYTKTATEIMVKLRPSVVELAKGIAAETLSLVNSAQFRMKNYAVVLVGGGSLTPALDHELSQALDINRERIGMRTPAMVNRFNMRPELVQNGLAPFCGPHAAVALGIASIAADYPAVAIVHVTVNDAKVELLNFKGGELTVLSALVAAGISKQKIYGKPGLAKTVTVNGELKVVRGGMPVPAGIFINDRAATISDVLSEGDMIRFTPAQDGLDAQGTVRDVIGADENFMLNGETVAFPVDISLNGIPASDSMPLPDNGSVTVRRNRSLAALLAQRGIAVNGFTPAAISVDVMGRPERRVVKNTLLAVNGIPVDSQEVFNELALQPGDNVVLQAAERPPQVSDFVAVPASGRELRIKINEEEFVFPGSTGKILLNGREVAEDMPVNDGDIIRTAAGRDAEAVLVDIFRYIAVNPRDSAGKRMKLLVNQEEANFTTPLTYGADVKVLFE